MAATLRLPLNIFESRCFLRVLDVLRPAAKKDVPTRRILSGSLLNTESAKLQEALPIIQQRELMGKCVGDLMDGFKNISQQHVWGIIVKCGDVWFAMDDGEGNVDSSDEHHGIVTAKCLEDTMGAAGEVVGAAVRALCVDQAGENGRAQRILSLRWPFIAMLPCFCHFFHNFAKQVLALPHFCEVFRVAAAIVTFIRKSSKKWKVRLDRETRRLYGKSPALVPLLEIRWNTAQGMAASMLRVKTGLSLFARPFRHEPKFPSSLDRLDDPGFWALLKEGEEGVRGLRFASMILQRDDNRPADVVLMFGHIFESARTSTDGPLNRIIRLRWSMVEQPLLLLAWVLDPRFVAVFNRAKVLVPGSFPALFVADIATFYYRKFFGDDATGVALAVTEWLQQSWAEIRNNGLGGIWEVVRHHQDLGRQKLARLAVHVESLPIQAAGAGGC
eukprot:GHVU01077936.1.p1 GENE.GHVU01077936.1~~GHVU01077936.1.p1  ORF type:complete len:487 (-),score=55.69 GHVU01077936.1:1891-3222(-)